MPRNKALLFLSAICGLLPPLNDSAHAQNQESDSDPLVVEQLLVTARKRSESLRDVPLSVNLTSGEELERFAVTNFEELHPYVPSFHMTETAIGSNIFIRGIGSGVNQGFEQSVGIYVDGVYFGRAQLSRLPFFDLDRIEVLRGPQSTLFGKNSISGALNLVTRRPGEDPEAEVRARYEPVLDETEIQGVLSGTIGARSGARLVVRSLNSNGYVRNTHLQRDEPRRDEEAIRFVFESDATESLSFMLKAESAQFDVVGRQIEIIEDRPAAGGPFAGLTYGEVLAGVFQQPSSVLDAVPDYRRGAGGDYSSNRASNLTFSTDWRIGDSTLQFITGYTAYDYGERCDCDITAADIFSVALAEDFSQISQEIRLMSPSGGPVEYIVGAYFQDNSLDFFDSIEISDASVLVQLADSNPALPMPPFPPMPGSTLLAETASPRFFSQESDVAAIFGQVTRKIGDRLRLNFGGRFTHETKTAARNLAYTRLDGGAIDSQAAPLVAALYNVLFNATPHSIAGHREQDKFMPSLQLEWDATGSILAYFSAAKGFKSGGFDARSNNPPVNPVYPDSVGTFSFDDEEALNLEIGAKMSLARGRGELYGALYDTRYDDMQVSTYDGTLGFNVGNAGRAGVRGLELEGRYRLNEKLTISGGLAWTDFEFEEYVGQCYFGRPPDAPDGINCDYRGRTNQFVADYSGLLSLEGRAAVGAALQIRWKLHLIHTDDYLLAPTLHPAAVQEAYTKLNAAFSIASSEATWELALIGKNLTDEASSSYGNETPLAASVFGAPGFFNFVDPPRSAALQATFRFR